MKNIFKLVLSMLVLAILLPMQADTGSGFAGGLFTGAVIGGLARPRRYETVYVEREPVYIQDNDTEELRDEIAYLRKENKRLRAQVD